jgi:hypothetical protein
MVELVVLAEGRALFRWSALSAGGEGFCQNIKLLSEILFVYTSVIWSRYPSTHNKIKASSIVGM